MPRFRLTEGARQELEWIARTTRDARLLRRAQVLLDLDGGDSAGLVARRYQVSRSTIYNWVTRFSEMGPGAAGLSDRPRPGRPRAGATRQASVGAEARDDPRSGAKA